MAQLAKNLPANSIYMVQLGRKIPRGEEMATHPAFLPGSHGQRSLATVCGVTRAGHNLVAKTTTMIKLWEFPSGPVAPNERGLSSIHGQGTRSHLPYTQRSPMWDIMTL